MSDTAGISGPDGKLTDGEAGRYRLRRIGRAMSEAPNVDVQYQE
jgi:hypothetical protein